MTGQPRKRATTTRAPKRAPAKRGGPKRPHSQGTWLLTWRPPSPARAKPMPWLLITGAGQAKPAEVLAAFRTSRLAARYNPGQGHLAVEPVGIGAALTKGLETVSWEQLAPSVRRITLAVPAATHAAIELAAARRGMTMGAWAAGALSAQAAAELGQQVSA